MLQIEELQNKYLMLQIEELQCKQSTAKSPITLSHKYHFGAGMKYMFHCASLKTTKLALLRPSLVQI